MAATAAEISSLVARLPCGVEHFSLHLMAGRHTGHAQAEQRHADQKPEFRANLGDY